jgi:4-amino-4-deoxy-L-arabinose transferase-like glycosyltransferase
VSEPFALGRHACAALLVLTAILFAVIHTDYGITWDEGVQSTYGEQVLDYFASLGRDTRCNDYLDLRSYGPLFESAVALVYRAAGGFKYEIRHAAIGLAALLTLVAVWRLGLRLGGPAVAGFALLALLTMPRFVGHAFNNSKDVPFACAFAWAMVAMGRLLGRGGWRWTNVLACGVAIGVALAVRVGALVLVAYLVAAWLVSVALGNEERRAWRDRVPKLVAVAALAWTVMVLFWPWAHGAPLARPLAALAETTRFPQSYPVLFGGRLVPSDELPRTYTPAYLGMVTPLATLALAIGGLGVAGRGLVARPRDPRTLLVGLVTVWALFPIAYAVIARPNVYDGIRHLLFVLPALALLCGMACAALVQALRGRARSLGGAAASVLLLLPVPEMVRLHPYQSSYFNATVGGLTRAWRSYDADYWVSSYREAMLWVLDRIPAGERATIAVACNDHNRPCAESYLPPPGEGPGRVSLVCVWEGNERVPTDTRFFIGTLRYGKATTFFPDWPVTHIVGRAHAPLTLIKHNPKNPGHSEFSYNSPTSVPHEQRPDKN